MDDAARSALRSTLAALNPAVFSERARDAIQEIDELAPVLGTTRYVECRLGGSSASQVDYLFSVTSHQCQPLARALEARASDDASLSAMRRFLDRWANPSSCLLDAVPVAWFEFDDVGKHLHVPNVCVCVAPAYRDPFAVLDAAPAATLLETLREAAHVILDRECDSRERDAFERCIDGLPDGARVIHLSVMTTRSPIELKLYGAFPTDSVVRYLSEIGWRGDLDGISRLLERYCPVERTAGVVYVDLPLTHMDAPDRARLGINFAQQQLQRAVESDATRAALLQVLLEDGLCVRPLRDTLVEWPGVGPTVSLDRHHDARVERWFDVKIVHEPARGLTAKAYLALFPRRLRATESQNVSAAGVCTPP